MLLRSCQTWLLGFLGSTCFQVLGAGKEKWEASLGELKESVGGRKAESSWRIFGLPRDGLREERQPLQMIFYRTGMRMRNLQWQAGRRGKGAFILNYTLFWND